MDMEHGRTLTKQPMLVNGKMVQKKEKAQKLGQMGIFMKAILMRVNGMERVN